MQSMTLEQSLVEAMRHLQAGRLDEAENHYRQILARYPDSADALHLLGVLCAQRGRNQQAVELIRQAISRRPQVAGFHANLGRVLFADKRFEEAAAAYREAARLNPQDAELQKDLGFSLKEIGRLEEALSCARQALRLNPNSARAEYLLGSTLQVRGELDEAVRAYQRASELEPNSALAQIDVGNALRSGRRWDEAVACYRRALSIQPDFADAISVLADTLRDAGRLEEALAANDKALALRPDWALLWSNRGDLLRDLMRPDKAVDAIRRALQIDPDSFEARLNLATNLLEIGRVDQAMEAARRCVQLDPHSYQARNVLASVLKDDGQVEKAVEEFDSGLEIDPDNAVIHSNKVYVLEFDPRCDAMGLFAEARRWNQRHALPMKKFIRDHENDRSADRPLRLGYVSPNFCNHAISFFLVSLLEQQDRDQFEIHCYSDGSRIDAATRRIKPCAHVWHVSSPWTTDELAEQIRRDRIDILVDLTMHMTGNRLPMFAQKPAPVQVAWIAYPGGTGLDAIDYRVSDPWIDPPEMDESCYRERTVRLPDTWLCYDPLCEIAPVGPRAEGPICFGSMNNPCKLNDPLLRLWARVMHAVPDSRLRLQAFDKGHRRRLTEFFLSAGVGGDRVEFLNRCRRMDYLRLYDRIDICLDPLPHNGITTTCDALWMGVAVITLTGQTAAGRGATSILANVGLGELIARDPEQFVQIAVALADDAPRLAEMRRTLRDRFSRSPMMDAPRFARAMEAAYRQMWRNWCDGVQ